MMMGLATVEAAKLPMAIKAPLGFELLTKKL